MTETEKKPENRPPDATIIVGTHCPHCPVVLASLAEMLKAGTIGRLEAVNLEARPDVAEALGVRSVPWIRIGPFTLTGAYRRPELEAWVEKAGSVEGQADYLAEMLGSGQLDAAEKFVRETPGSMVALIHLLADPQQKINVKSGLGVIFESLEGSPELAAAVDALGKLVESPSVEVRADACHYLGLTHAPAARPYLERCLKDDDADVREIAEESLALLQQAGNPET